MNGLELLAENKCFGFLKTNNNPYICNPKQQQ